MVSLKYKNILSLKINFFKIYMEEKMDNKNSGNNFKKNYEKENYIIEEDEISLIDIFKVLWRQKWFIIGFTFIVTLVSVVIMFFFIPKKYKYKYNVKMSSLNYNEYIKINNELKDSDYIKLYFESMDDKYKKYFEFKDYKSLFKENELIMQFKYFSIYSEVGKDLFKGYFTSDGQFIQKQQNYFYFYFVTNKENSELSKSFMKDYIENYFKNIYFKNLNENFILSKFDSILNVQVNFATLLIEKDKLEKRLENLQLLKKKYPSLVKMDYNIINIQGASTGAIFTPIDAQIAQIEKSLNENKLKIKSYFINKMLYNYYYKVKKLVLNYKINCFDNMFREKYFKFMVAIIKNTDVDFDFLDDSYNFNKNDFIEILDKEKKYLLYQVDNYYTNFDTYIKLYSFEVIKSSRDLMKKSIIALFAAGFIALILAFIIDFVKHHKNELIENNVR